MPLLRYRPQPPLSEFVELLWFSKGNKVSHERERLLPEGTCELVINLEQDRIRVYDSADCSRFHTIPGGVISGPRSECFVIDTDTQAHTIGVHFKPGGAFPFFPSPARELNNQSVALQCLWGRQADWLRERLLEAGSVPAQFRVLEKYLLGRLHSVQVHPVVAFAVQQLIGRQPPAISLLIERVGFSQRHFTQLFTNQVGLTPKVFSRVGRFQKVVQTIHAGNDMEWMELALSCGYYDQAHFIHDFQSFAGMTPTEYLARRTQHVNHVPVVS